MKLCASLKYFYSHISFEILERREAVHFCQGALEYELFLWKTIPLQRKVSLLLNIFIVRKDSFLSLCMIINRSNVSEEHYNILVKDW